jgi:hypothetical protein
VTLGGEIGSYHMIGAVGMERCDWRECSGVAASVRQMDARRIKLSLQITADPHTHRSQRDECACHSTMASHS